MNRISGTKLFGLTVVLVLLLDQLSKWLVREMLAVGESYPSADTLLGGVFSFTRVSNTGIAFGLFQGRSELFVASSLAVVAAILVYRTRVPATDRWLQVALGLQVGGATGNILDRVVRGHVTDFFDFKVWPVFNISDLSIFIGVVMLAWHLWQEERLATAAARTEAESALAKGPEPTESPPTAQSFDRRDDGPLGGTVGSSGSVLSPAPEERGD